MHVYIKYMYIAVYLRYHVSLLVNINIFYMTPQRATWKNSYYMLNVLPSLNKVLLLLLFLGRLHITNIKAEDHAEGRAYCCFVFNYVLRILTFDVGHVIEPQGSEYAKCVRRKFYILLS